MGLCPAATSSLVAVLPLAPCCRLQAPRKAWRRTTLSRIAAASSGYQEHGMAAHTEGRLSIGLRRPFVGWQLAFKTHPLI